MLSTHTNSQHGKNPLSPRKSPALAAAPGESADQVDPVDPLASSPHHQHHHHHHHHHHEHGSAGAAGGRPASSSGAAATTLAQRLELVARRFVSNVVGWPGGGGGGGSSEEEEERGGEEQPREGDVGSGDIETAARVASMMLAPGAAVHVGGVWADVLAPGQPDDNEDALFEYLSRERAAYQLLELQPLAVAVAVDSEPAVAGLGGGGGGAAADPTPTASAAAHAREVVEEGEKLERRDGAGGGAGAGACGGGGGGGVAGGGGGGDVAFVLSRFRMKHVGGWLGRAPTGRVSEGLRVDELRFDPEAKIAAAWCTRQLTQEELEVLRARPGGGEGEGAEAGEGAVYAKAPALEPSLLRLQASELAPHKMMQVAALWSQAWNVATDAGAVNPDLLDCLAEPTLTATDMSGLGLGGGGGSGGGVGGGGGGGGEEQQHPFTAIRSRDDAKAALAALCASYEVDEGLVTAAAARGTNAAFCHWRARLTPRRRGGSSGAGSGSTQDAATPQPGGGRLTAAITTTAAAGSGSSGGGRGSSSGGGGHGLGGSYVAEGLDLLLFAPSGKLQAIAQFRRPLGWERRTLLSAAGLAAAMAEAGVAEAAAVAKGPGVCLVDNAPAGAPEGIIA